MVTRSLVTGTPCTVVDRCEPAEIERQARAGATLVSLVATVLGRTDTSGFRTVLLGGAAPPEELPPQVVTTYGMTETGSGVVYDGRPLEGVEVRIGDPAVGVPGEVPERGDGAGPDAAAGLPGRDRIRPCPGVGCPPATAVGWRSTARCGYSDGWPR